MHKKNVKYEKILINIHKNSKLFKILKQPFYVIINLYYNKCKIWKNKFIMFKIWWKTVCHFDTLLN